MSATTRDYLLKFWSVVDDLLNALLFLLIGLEVVTIPSEASLLAIGAAAIPLVLLARAVSVLVPLVAVKPFLSLGRLAPATRIWGGMRGGISVALALSLPHSAASDLALPATYLIVLFFVTAQGGSIERVLAAMSRRAG